MTDTPTQTIREAIDAVKVKILDALSKPTTHDGTRSDLQRVVGIEQKGYAKGLPNSRVMDRALQELKKEGKAAYVARRWTLVAKGELRRR